jgi:hypothetical protein
MKKATITVQRHKPSTRECMLLFLRLVQERENRRHAQMTRAQIAEGTLKKLWNRERLTEQFLEDVQEWLLTAGWALFYAGPIYGAVKVEAVENWPSVSAKRIESELVKVASGQYQFEKLESLLVGDAGAGDAAPQPHPQPSAGTGAPARRGRGAARPSSAPRSD